MSGSGARNEVLNQEQFDVVYGSRSIDLSAVGSAKKRLKALKQVETKECLKWTASWFPIIDWGRNYQIRENLFSDVIAGLTVGIMNIPQGMAYGMLAGLDPVYGLYTSFLPPMIYAIFGSSKHISFGTFAVVSLMVASVVDRLTPPADVTLLSNTSIPTTPAPTIDPTKLFWCGNSAADGERNATVALEIAVSYTLVVGMVQILLGVLNMGFLAVYLSDQIVEGLTTGAAIHVFSSQVPHILGLKGLPRTGEPLGLLKFYVCLFMTITKTNWPTVIASVICIVSLVVVKELLDPWLKLKIKFPIPIELIVVVVSTLVSSYGNLEPSYEVATVGFIPSGFQVTTLPNLHWFPELLADAITLAVVVFSINVSVGKLLAKKHDYSIEPNQEWFATGFASVISSFVSCHCAGPSLSRSLLQSNQGGKSQVVSFVSSGMILVVLLALASLFQPLPKCALASIIIVALKGMFMKFGSLPALYRKSGIDFLIWVVTFLSVIFLNVSYGLGFGVGFALLTVVFRSQWPDSVCLGRVGSTDCYKSLVVYEKAQEIPGIKIYRFDSPLYFANVERFREELYKSTGIDPVVRRKALRKKEEKKKKAKSNNRKRDVKPDKTQDQVDQPLELVRIESPPEKERHGLRHSLEELNIPSLKFIIIDCSSFPYLDLMGTESLAQIYEEYGTVDITVYFAFCKVSVRQMFEKCGFYERVPRRCLFVEVKDAVEYASTPSRPSTSHSHSDSIEDVHENSSLSDSMKY